MPGYISLPYELWVHVLDLLSFEDYYSLSLVNKSLRKAVSPRLFRQIQVATDRSLPQDFFDHHGDSIWHITLRCRLYPNPADPKDGLPPRRVSESTRALIRDARHCRSMSVCFSFSEEYDRQESLRWTGFDPSVWHSNNPYFEYDKNLKYTRYYEGKFAWRSMLADTWLVVASNPRVRELQVHNVPAKLTSTFKEEQWKSFLRRLKKFEFLGCPRGEHVPVEGVRGYRKFFKQMSYSIFRRLPLVQRLKLRADESSPYGAFNAYDPWVPLPLRPGFMPQLRSLHLEQLVLSRDLYQFLVSLANVLQELHLADCKTTLDKDDPDHPGSPTIHPWASIWKLCRKELPALRRVSFTQRFPPPVLPGSSVTDPPELMDDETKRLIAGKAWWPYVYHNSHGFIFNLRTLTWERLRRGVDWREYQLLQQDLEKRRAMDME